VWGLGFPRVRTKGTPVGWDQAPFVVSNHIGVIEGAFLLSVYRASAVSALENTKVPILGRCALFTPQAVTCDLWLWLMFVIVALLFVLLCLFLLRVVQLL
jgi:hypothetical protein